MNHLPQLVRALCGPLLIEPGVGTKFLEIFARKYVAGEPFSGAALHAELGIADEEDRPESTTTAGIAVIPIVGVIAQRPQSLGASVQQISRQLTHALTDRSIDAVLLDIDSPGGSPTGVPELAAQIRAASKVKPIAAIANGMAASAGYYLAAATNVIWVLESGEGAGSIGVWTAHENWERRLEELGIEITEISAGRFKTELAFWKALSPEAKEFLTNQVKQLYDWFIRDVAAYRKDSQANVRAGYGEGRVLPGQDAVKARLADHVGTIEEAIQHLAQRARGKKSVAASLPTSTPGAAMLGESETPTATAPDAPSPAAVVAAPAAPAAAAEPSAVKDPSPTPALAEQLAAARVEGATAERTRLLGILAYAKQGDGTTLRACLEDPACSVEQAAKRLLDAGRGKADAHLAALAGDEAAMQPPSAVPGAGAETSPDSAVAARVLSIHRALHPDRALAQRT